MNIQSYTDFTVTVENCENEPIHRPNGIQSHGYLLVIREDTAKLSAYSDNIGVLFPELKLSELWQKDWIQLLPEELQTAIKGALEGSVDPYQQKLINCKGQPLNLLMHQWKAHIFVELERADEYEESEMGNYEAMEAFRTQAEGAESVADLYQSTTRVLKQISGYDRVMMYRFHEDWHGEVVGEALNHGLEPYLGLHYPASDIPAIARRLFMENEIRIISDIDQAASALVYNPGIGSTESLDMTYAHLRTSSPIHIEYLKNMGVQSTFTIAIKEHGKLWGLFAFHHYSPRLLSFKARRIVQFLAESFAIKCIHSRLDENTALLESKRRSSRMVLNQLDKHQNLHKALLGSATSIMDCFSADGVLVVEGGERKQHGYVPTHDQVNAILHYLRTQKSKKLFYTDAMDELLYENHPPRDHAIGGVVALPISIQKNTYVMLFKQPMVQTVDWGGNPEKAVGGQRDPRNGLLKLSPRISFERWKQETSHKSAPWEESDLQIAELIQDKIVHVILQSEGEIARLNEQINLLREEMEEFVYIASHDMQEPLRTILNYVELLGREEYINNPTSRNNFLDRISSSGSRLREMIKELLHYSRIGRAGLFNKEWINLHEVIGLVRQNLAHSIERSQAIISTDTLPDIYGSKSDLVRLMQNLISNAIKYAKDDVNPRIHISAKRESNGWRLSIEDNGIGIDESNQELVFQMFQRLHDQRKYQGNGIGLAICHKIMQVHDGSIWFNSTPGEGTNFHMTFNNP